MKTFNSTDLKIVYGGVEITGLSAGQFIDISYDDDIYKYMNGVDGEVARVKSGKLMATVVIRLLQTSASNDVLSGFMIADIAGNIPQDLIIKDLSGTSIMTGVQSSIPKFANSGYSEDPINREWTIKVPRLLSFIGGNYSFFNLP